MIRTLRGVFLVVLAAMSNSFASPGDGWGWS